MMMMLIFPLYCCLYLIYPCMGGNLDANSKECEASCEKTYPLHTYPSAEHLESCKRGCRLSTLIHFMHDGKDFAAVKDLCYSACREAYNQTYEHYACNIGCSNQDSLSLKTSEKNETSYDLVFHMQSIFEKMSGFVSSSWVLYIADDRSGKNSVIASAENVAAPDDTELHKSMALSDAWMSYQNDETSDWFPKSGMPVACFYDFLHFLFFKIIVLFLIFLFILTVLTLMRITLFDIAKKQRGYVSFIESSQYSAKHPHVTKMEA